MSVKGRFHFKEKGLFDFFETDEQYFDKGKG
jgi:hypothetical protein